MKEEIVQAILLKATDYRENDRLVRLLSLQGGLLFAVMKGVKKQGAKLKFGAQPFAFCEYTLAAGRGGYPTVTGCAVQGDFFALAADPDKYLVGSLLLESAEAAAYGAPSPALFVLLLDALRELAYGESLPTAVGARFLLGVCDLSGFAVRYPFAGNLQPTNLSDANAALQNTPMQTLARVQLPPPLALRALKMQARRFEGKLDVRLKSLPYITG